MRLLAALRREQAGLTLIELLIAMALTALIATLGTWMFVAGTHSVSLAQSIDGGTRQASNGMNQAARMLRAATPNPLTNPTPGGQQAEPAILAATANSIAFYAYVNLTGAESPVMAQFSVDANGRLIEQQWNPTSTVAGVNGHWSFPNRATATPAVKRALCNSIPGDAVVFRYFDKTGTELLPAALTTDAQRAAIASVQVTITIRATGAASAVTLTNTISMANVGAGS
jgi:prepilin-type N-terminal cleavage/methylation domain-containing protein